MDCMIFMTGVLLWLVESSLARLVLDFPKLIPQPSIIVYSFTFFSLFILSFPSPSLFILSLYYLVLRRPVGLT